MRSTILAAMAALDERTRPTADSAAWRRGLHEFLLFGLKQARASLFGAMMLTLIVATHYLWPANAPLHRYDFLTLSAVTLQIALITLKLERLDEALVILVFHI